MDSRRNNNDRAPPVSETKDASANIAAVFTPPTLTRSAPLVSCTDAFVSPLPLEACYGMNASFGSDHDVARGLAAAAALSADAFPDTLRSPEIFRAIDMRTAPAPPQSALDAFGSAVGATKELSNAFDTFPSSLHSHLPSLDDQLEPPEPKGGYLEPYYHCFTVSRPRDVLQVVSGALRENAVDVESKAHKFKLVCEGYQGSGKISFKVRIYRIKPAPGAPVVEGGVDGQGTRYCIEFQRRSGDSFRFCEIYKAAMSALCSRGFVHIPVSVTQKPSWQPAGSSVDPTKLPDTVKFLVQMANSEFFDVKSEGMRSLCDLSTEMVCQSVLLAEGVFDVFLSHCGHEVEDVNRCSITGLANLAKSRAAQCKSLVSHGCVRSLIRDITAKSTTTPQIVRETARLLVAVSEQVGRSMIDSDMDNARSALQELMCSPDPIVRQHADQLQHFVGGGPVDDDLAPPRLAQV